MCLRICNWGATSHSKNWPILCSPWAWDALYYLKQLVGTPDADSFESLCSYRYLHVKKFAQKLTNEEEAIYLHSIFRLELSPRHWEKQWPLIWISSVPSVQHMPSIFLSFHTFQASSEVMLQYFSLKVSECGSAASSWAFNWRANSKLMHLLSVSIRGCRWQKMFAT